MPSFESCHDSDIPHTIFPMKVIEFKLSKENVPWKSKAEENCRKQKSTHTPLLYKQAPEVGSHWTLTCSP